MSIKAPCLNAQDLEARVLQYEAFLQGDWVEDRNPIYVNMIDTAKRKEKEKLISHHKAEMDSMLTKRQQVRDVISARRAEKDTIK